MASHISLPPQPSFWLLGSVATGGDTQGPGRGLPQSTPGSERP